MIFVNFKTYKEASGESAVKLAQIIKKVSNETGVEVIACPQPVDFKDVVLTGASVWAQNVDPVEPGKTTGWLPPLTVKELGGVGTLLNHSEHKVSFDVLEKAMLRSREAGLKIVAIANSLEEAKKIVVLKPDFLGYEPPEFVGSTTTSVAQALPDVIKEVVQAASPLKVLIGAGVHRAEDIRIGRDLGAVGVILATDVVLAQDPERELRKLTEGYK